jgi:hypothetical protein
VRRGLSDLKDRELDMALLSFEPEERELESHFIMRDEILLRLGKAPLRIPPKRSRQLLTG